jgi:predicted kinase
MSDVDTLIYTIQNTEKTLFILCGFPYAGKSYVANEVLKHTDAVLVSIDAIFRAHGFDWNTNTLPKEDEWHHIFNESYEKAKEALKHGKNILYDSTNQTIAGRDVLRDVAHSVGADARVVFITSSVEKVWERWEENQKNPIRSIVSKALVQTTIDSFEEPLENENVIVVQN